jgi:GTP-binding protein YchF
MEIGILGLPQSGKSMLFEIMTGVHSRDMHSEPCIRGLTCVPDERFDDLVQIYQPQKISPAKIPFIDINTRGENSWDPIRQTLNGADCVIHVVDGFSTQEVHDIVRRHRKIEDELVLSDLMVVENRLEKLTRIPTKALKPLDLSHLPVLPALKEQLEKGLPIRDMGLPDDVLFSLKSFSFWTARPELVVINVGEDSLPVVEAFLEMTDNSLPVMDVCCQVEAELIGLTAEEQKEFLSAMDIREPAFKRTIKEAFSLLGRISFFTVGEDEVKAWVIPQGSRAPRAAAAIHKDFERGFIRAEVVSYEDFVMCGKSLAKAKSAGKLRLEGKEYIVKDGDIISFRFNI